MTKKWDMDAVRAVAARGLVVTFNSHGNDEPVIAVQAKPHNKFGNEKTTVDNIRFDSKAESQRYGELKMMERSGLIHKFERQVTYSLDVNGVHICKYIADFVITWPDGVVTVEDVKGVQTPEFKLKKRLMWAIHGIEIILVTNCNNNGNINSKKAGARRGKRR